MSLRTHWATLIGIALLVPTLACSSSRGTHAGKQRSSIKKQTVPPGRAIEPDAKKGLIITPERGTTGKILSVNSIARYVVVELRPGTEAPIGKSFSVFSQGLKIGEIRITGPQQDQFTAADITLGRAKVGDVVLEE